MIGDRVLERFTLGEVLGEGGFGVVYRAWDERLDRPVAVKVLDEVEPERILREAQAVARLNHPGVVTLYEIGERAGRAFLVSELVEGMTLREALRKGRLRDHEVAEIGAELCEALAHAHERGVVHRDVKPENVIIGRRPTGARRGGSRAKLMDFGIAEMAGAPRLTRAGQILGTIAYASPEQVEGDRAGRESDVYSLALTLYECWSGANPIAAATPAATARRIGAELPSLADERPDLPPALTGLIDRCLDSDPLLRPDTEALGALLVASASRLSDDLVPPPAEAEEGDVASGAGRALALVASVGVLALLALAGMSGAAALAAVALIPAALLLTEREGLIGTVLAPPLVALGLAPIVAALAALPASAGARVTLATCGWLATICGSLLLGLDPVGGGDARLAVGWEGSAPVAAQGLAGALLAPGPLALLALWLGAGLALGALTELRRTTPALLGALLWSGATLAAGRVLNPALAGAAYVPALLLVAALGAILYVHGTPRLPDRHRPELSVLAHRDARPQPGR